MPEYTPDDEVVCDAYVEGRWEAFPQNTSEQAFAKFGAEFDRWLAAHDAAVRADQAEKDAQIAETVNRGQSSPGDMRADIIGGEIRRAAALTPTVSSGISPDALLAAARLEALPIDQDPTAKLLGITSDTEEPVEHHARVEQYMAYPGADYYGIKIVCPECESEWAWDDDIPGSGNVHRLERMAAEHNAAKRTGQ